MNFRAIVSIKGNAKTETFMYTVNAPPVFRVLLLLVELSKCPGIFKREVAAKLRASSTLVFQINSFLDSVVFLKNDTKIDKKQSSAQFRVNFLFLGRKEHNSPLNFGS